MLRRALVRLADQHPELRSKLVPLLRKTAYVQPVIQIVHHGIWVEFRLRNKAVGAHRDERPVFDFDPKDYKGGTYLAGVVIYAIQDGYWFVQNAEAVVRGEGYGTECYLAAIRYATQHGKGLVSTDQRSDASTKAQNRMVKQRGVKRIGGWFVYKGDDSTFIPDPKGYVPQPDDGEWAECFVSTPRAKPAYPVVRFARQVLAKNVTVTVIPAATEKAEKKWSPGVAVGRFESPISLYRVFDGEELRDILDTGMIKGGDYSVAAERAFGAQWATDRDAIAKWGEWQRGKRLGWELFIAEIEGKGRVFAHLTGADGKLKANSGTVSLDANFCHGGLGCSVHAGLRDVRAWYVVEEGRPRKVSLSEIKDMAETSGLKPRAVKLYKGLFLSSAATKVQETLRWKLFNDKAQRERYNTMQRIRGEQAMGFKSNPLPPEKIGRLLIREMCRVEDCLSWGTMHTRAMQDAQPSRSDGNTSFSIYVCIEMEVAVPHQLAELEEGHGKGKILYVDLYNPETRGWVRLWQPWGKFEIAVYGKHVGVR